MKPSTASAPSFLNASASGYEPSNSSAFASADRLSHVFANLQVDNTSAQGTSGFSSGRPLFSDSIWAAEISGYGRYLYPGSSSSSSSINNFPASTRLFYQTPLILTSGLENRANYPFRNPGGNVLDFGVNDILLMAKDEHGSKFLRDVLSFQGNSRIVSRVFEMVLEFTLEVMTSQHGRFVFGKLIESCNEDHLRVITFKIASDDNLFLNASRDMNGSSCIKKLIRVLGRTGTNFPKQIMFTLGRFFEYLMVDKTGFSIILLSLDNIYFKKNDFVYQAALEHCLSVANHEQGCISMNKFIDEMRGPRRKQILGLISMNAVYLAKNPYGNYVLQHVLGLEDPELIEKVCSTLRGSFIDLSMRKCGSHVVEKCLKYDNSMHYVVEEFIGSDQIVEVANHSFGNYVIQTALRKTMKVDRGLHERLVTKLRENISDLLQFGHGRHVYNLICS